MNAIVSKFTGNLQEDSGSISVFLLCLLSMLPLLPATAQNQALGTVSGYVYDASTNKPLDYVNIFLANTSQGCASNKNGRFSIPNIKPGQYQLVASMMGYAVDVRTIEVREGEKQEYTFRMVQKSIEAPTFTVTAKVDHVWQQNLREFIPLFLGISPDASLCRIENPEVLDLKRSIATGTLEASASEPLKIENNALGYQITFIMESFSAFKDGRVQYTGYARFKDLESDNPNQVRQWKVNRVKAYHGSLVHFLRSVIEKRTEEEGFTFYSETGGNGMDESYYSERLSPDSLTSNALKSNEILFHLPETIKIIYERESEPDVYLPFLKSKFGQDRSFSRQISYLQVHSQPLVSTRDGHLLFPHMVTTMGHLALERLAEMLPMDYQPEESRDIK